MIRFRNPGTSIDVQLNMMKVLYKQLGSKNSFSLDDMSVVFSNEKLMSSYGFAGEKAYNKSSRKDVSRDSIQMNTKMYAEVFRMLGWMTSAFDNKNYPLKFSYIGAHVANTNNIQIGEMLYIESMIGMVNPNEILNVKYEVETRVFKSILKAMNILDCYIYKHEMCMGPMSLDDTGDDWKNGIQELLDLRDKLSNQEFKKKFEYFCSLLNMAPTSVDNNTRTPVAMLKQSHLVSDDRVRIHGSSKKVLRLTDKGSELINKLDKLKDIRLNEFNQLEVKQQKALIRIGIFSILDRCKFNLDAYKDIIDNDKVLCEDFLKGKDVLFSPYQTLKAGIIDAALSEVGIKKDTEKDYNIEKFDKKTQEKEVTIHYDNLRSHFNDKNINIKKLQPITRKNIDKIYDLIDKKKSKKDIVQIIFDDAVTMSESEFYPLVSDILNISSLNCKCSRSGDNGARWDAIIIDNKHSIPIEIKSPTEEIHLSVKAIRQALENKIVLLSREHYSTHKSVVTLAIGYDLPNQRSEVMDLINAIKHKFDINIGVLGLKSLLNMLMNKLYNNQSVKLEDLKEKEGIINVSIEE